MFGIGSTELLVILIVALVVLGPKSLPGIAKTVGKVMGEFRRVSTEFQRTMNAEVANEEHEKRKKEAEEELFGQDKAAAKSADASTAKPASTAEASSVVDTEATVPAPTQACAETPVNTVAEDSPLAAAVAKAQAEAEATVVAPVATPAPAKEKEMA